MQLTILSFISHSFGKKKSWNFTKGKGTLLSLYVTKQGDGLLPANVTEAV